MSRTVHILTRARADIDHIFNWLERHSAQGAATWLQALFDRVASIAERADSYAIAPECLPRWKRTIRQAIFNTPRGRRYRIVFDATATEVRILRIRGPGQPSLRKRDIPDT